MPKRTRDHQSWLLEKLSDPKRAASYLNAARKDSQEMFFEALRDVAQVRQMTKVAKDAGVTRKSLYKVTSGAGNPTYGTFDSVLEAVGLDFIIKPREAAVAAIPPVSSITLGWQTTPLTAKPQIKPKRITLHNNGVMTTCIGASRNTGSGHLDEFFRAGSRTGAMITADNVNLARNGAEPPLPPAQLCDALLERMKYGQNSAGNTAIDHRI
jgi:probable addiction module antidote protein